jgi:hypothetical protein
MEQLSFSFTESQTLVQLTRATCAAAMQEFLGVFDTEARALIEQKIYLAGGAIVDTVLGITPQDYDIFCVDQATVDVISDRLPKTIALKSWTDNAMTFEYRGKVFQVVTRFHGEPSRVFTTFDFEHCKAFYRPAQGELFYYEDLIVNKKLRYTGEKDEYTLNTLKRFGKYTSRGWTPDNESVIRLHKACAKKDLDDPEEFKKQICGFYGSSFK